MTQSPPIRLSQLEIDCLKVLWRKPALRVAEVRSALTRPLAYTTVMTVLDRMIEKGAVTRRKMGRAYLYSAALDLESARTQAVRRLLDNLFDHDPGALAQFLLHPSEEVRSQALPSRRRPSEAQALRMEIDDSLL